jgi:hypothetical protein
LRIGILDKKLKLSMSRVCAGQPVGIKEMEDKNPTMVVLKNLVGETGLRRPSIAGVLRTRRLPRVTRSGSNLAHRFQIQSSRSNSKSDSESNSFF